jgi:hypothetical protein
MLVRLHVLVYERGRDSLTLNPCLVILVCFASVIESKCSFLMNLCTTLEQSLYKTVLKAPILLCMRVQTLMEILYISLVFEIESFFHVLSACINYDIKFNYLHLSLLAILFF